MTEKISSAVIFEPRAISRESLADPRRTICSEGKILVVYCERHSCGGIYDLQVHGWTMFSPITAADFIAALPRIGVVLEDTPDLHAWLDAISAKQPSSGRH